MHRLFLFTGIIIAVVGITWGLKVSAQQQKPPDKRYSVTLPLQDWVQTTNQLEYIKNYLRHTKLPSDEVAFISDSLLTPIQSVIGQQVNAQMTAEKLTSTVAPKISHDSTTKTKKN